VRNILPEQTAMSLEFLITTLIVVLLPGTGVIYTLAAGLTRGARASMLAAFGCTLGIVPHVAASVLGLAALLHTSALAFQTLKYLGVIYLFYMAWQMWRDATWGRDRRVRQGRALRPAGADAYCRAPAF
jgi:threonine/homoserine/homoserine lactone efflux protein